MLGVNKMAKTSEILRKVFKEAKEAEQKVSFKGEQSFVKGTKRLKKSDEGYYKRKSDRVNRLADMKKEKDSDKLSSKLERGYLKAEQAADDFLHKGSYKDVLRKADKKAGEAVDWSKENWGKVAAGTGAAVAGVAGAAALSSRDSETKKQIKRIKAKHPSERTAAERRLLRIMDEDD